MRATRQLEMSKQAAPGDAFLRLAKAIRASYPRGSKLTPWGHGSDMLNSHNLDGDMALAAHWSGDWLNKLHPNKQIGRDALAVKVRELKKRPEVQPTLRRYQGGTREENRLNRLVQEDRKLQPKPDPMPAKELMSGKDRIAARYHHKYEQGWVAPGLRQELWPRQTRQKSTGSSWINRQPDGPSPSNVRKDTELGSPLPQDHAYSNKLRNDVAEDQLSGASYHGMKKASRRLQMAEQMRKQAAAEFVNSFMPWESARNAGTEMAGAFDEFGKGNLVKGTWGGIKSLGNAAMMIPGAGALGWLGKLGFKTIKGVGGALNRAGNAFKGSKKLPGLSNAAGGISNTFGRAAQGFGQFGEKMVKPIDGMNHMAKFQGKMLGGGRAATAATVLPFAGLAEMGGEAAWGARPNIFKPKLPESTGTSNQHFQTAKTWLGPQGGSPVNAGHNVEFPT